MSANNFENSLRELGVNDNSLSAEQRRALDGQGYLIFQDVIEPTLLRDMRTAFERIAGSTKSSTSDRKETGTRHPSDLLRHDPIFAAVCLQPVVLAATHHILRRAFRLSQIVGRDPLPGFGQQGLHADWIPRPRREPYQVVTSMWMLDDFTHDNGATRVVPGTHHEFKTPPKAQSDPASHHPDEIIVTASAGSVLLFNGHLWHSGTRNNSQHSRRALQCVFWAREMFPPYAQPLCDQPETLPASIRCLLN